MSKETKAKRAAIKAERLETLPNYYDMSKETVSASGKVYYNLRVSPFVKTKASTDIRTKIIGSVFMEWLGNKLGM
jgi:hypothetical protein